MFDVSDVVDVFRSSDDSIRLLPIFVKMLTKSISSGHITGILAACHLIPVSLDLGFCIGAHRNKVTQEFHTTKSIKRGRVGNCERAA